MSSGTRQSVREADRALADLVRAHVAVQNGEMTPAQAKHVAERFFEKAKTFASKSVSRFTEMEIKESLRRMQEEERRKSVSHSLSFTGASQSSYQRPMSPSFQASSQSSYQRPMSPSFMSAPQRPMSPPLSPRKSISDEQYLTFISNSASR